jgi:hypothetical protein
VRVDTDYLTNVFLKLPAQQQAGVAAEARPVAGARSLKFPLDASVPISFSRPVYPYPYFAKYSGHGSTKDAANFRRAVKE